MASSEIVVKLNPKQMEQLKREFMAVIVSKEAEIVAKDEEIARLRFALADIAHGAIYMTPPEAEKLYRRIAEHALKSGTP